ncbi:hypothetical protein F5Y14DRAFT_421954 [Nemania sp. NC0429]|nr:hypothetical protein F5Y14DRAFT_421954 [Nemania sp. NC0429]
MQKPPTAVVGSWSKQAWSQVLSRTTNARARQFPQLSKALSPSRILALCLMSKDNYQRSRFRLAIWQIINLRTGRLPILTLQYWLAKQDPSPEKELVVPIIPRTQADWDDALNGLAQRGWSKDHLDHWIWILSGENGDARVERLLSPSHLHPKPIFLLLLLLRSNESFRKPESLISLIHYTSTHHMARTCGTTPEEQAHPRHVLTVTQFICLMRRLSYHVKIVHPPSIIAVAHLIADYIKSIPNDPHHTHHRTDYYHQCLVYNVALVCLRVPTPKDPLINMELNWRAQRFLLATSDGLDKPLIINKRTYQAIRKVLVGLKKSRGEKAVALRYAKSWPPYRQDFDGRDVKRTAADDMSRSVRAGVLMVEAGYPPSDYDRALDVLGGSNQGSPTIQTRSLPPKQWMGPKEGWNIYSHWAMSVRATRNAQEAWRIFNRFPGMPGLAPNREVYSEMFLKLQAATVDPEPGSDLLPGESRETFPVHDANYSPYELARLSPPTVPELYDEMISRGIRPGGYGLHSLVSHATSVEEGLRYLQDSGIPSEVIKSMAVFRQPSYAMLMKVPLLSFSSFIRLLCRLQPDRRGREKVPVDELHRIRHAIKLVSIRLAPDTVEGTTFRSPWQMILQELTRPHIAIRNGLTPENNVEVLALFVEVFRSARNSIGIDADLFMLLCRVIQRAALSRLSSLSNSRRAKGPLVPRAQDLFYLITSTFSELTTPIAEKKSASLQAAQFQYPLRSPHLHAYMRALGFLDAKKEMIRLAFWMLDNYGFVDQEADRLGARGQAMIASTFCAFHAFAGSALAEDNTVQQELQDRMDRLIANGGHWRWPTPEEVEGYLSGGSEILQRRNAARSYLGL